MELSIKLELNDEQYADFSKSAKDAVETIMKDESFKDNVLKLLNQAIANYLNSAEGKEVAKQAVMASRWYNTFRSDFSDFMVEKTGQEFFEMAKGPFQQVYYDTLKDTESMRKIMEKVLVHNLSAALVEASSKRISEVEEVSYITAGRVETMANEINRISNGGNCF